jgi:adenosylmethionine-8-amino-7-oxononanoate aminotransferase
LRDIPIVSDVRGIGLMGCVECELNQGGEDLTMDYEIGNRIDKHCQALGLLVRPLVNMCVMSPPLTITREQIDEMIGILRQGIELTMRDIYGEVGREKSDDRHQAWGG